MPDPESRGIDIKLAEDGSLKLLCLLLDDSNNKVTTGTTQVRIWHSFPNNVGFEAYDFDDDTFKTGALTTAFAAATHQTVNNGTYSTGIWALRHTALDAFQNGHQYLFEVYNAAASPPAIPRWFQYGWGADVWGAPRGPGGILCVTEAAGVGGLSFADLKSMLQLVITRTWKAEARFITPLLISSWINSAYQEMDRKLRWTRCNYEFNTALDIEEYAIPTSLREYLAVEYQDTDGNISQLEEISLREFIAKRGDSTDSGSPHYYVQHGDKFELYPMPDTVDETVRIWGVLEPQDLAEDDDTPGFPIHLHQFIIDLGLSYACRYFGDFERAVQLQTVVEGKLMGERKEPAMDRGHPKRIIHRSI